VGREKIFCETKVEIQLFELVDAKLDDFIDSDNMFGKREVTF